MKEQKDKLQISIDGIGSLDKARRLLLELGAEEVVMA